MNTDGLQEMILRISGHLRIQDYALECIWVPERDYLALKEHVNRTSVHKCECCYCKSRPGPKPACIELNVAYGAIKIYEQNPVGDGRNIVEFRAIPMDLYKNG